MQYETETAGEPPEGRQDTVRVPCAGETRGCGDTQATSEWTIRYADRGNPLGTTRQVLASCNGCDATVAREEWQPNTLGRLASAIIDRLTSEPRAQSRSQPAPQARWSRSA